MSKYQKDIHINIVSFNNPFPPDLGGLIDVFYRIKYLSDLGVKIHLHTFSYDRLPNEDELLKYCETVRFYERKIKFVDALSMTPFIVKSRKHPDLLKNLQSNSYPILFEGTHSCAFLNHPSLVNRRKIVRMHNVEADYYQLLAKSESNIKTKIYNLTEAWKLRRFDKILSCANAIATVSIEDTNHYDKINRHVTLIPSSHPYNTINSKTGLGTYTLYHGNLSVSENEQAALYLIQDVFANLKCSLIIAGKAPTSRLIKAAALRANTSIIANPDEATMKQLIVDAQILALPTFQSTGLKLKLLYSLFIGRHCVVNKQMLIGTSLSPFCKIANTAEDMQNVIAHLMNTEFGIDEQNSRKKLENSIYSNKRTAKQWLSIIKDKNT